MLTYIVSKTKQGTNIFPSVTAALLAAKENPEEELTISIEPGIYHEKVEVCRSNVTLYGANVENTIITYDDFANKLLPDGTKYGTFRSYTMLLDGHDIKMSGLTVENASPNRHTCGQAIALYADGDRITVTDCILKSFQDTLFTGPLPPTVVIPGGFVGPKEFAPRINGRQYYKNCRISGDIDFIFGSATAFFENCDIVCTTDAETLQEMTQKAASGEEVTCGYVTAASTPEGQAYGYVFDHCRITGDCPSASFYLGRPWRNYAQTVFLQCELGPQIKPAGFHDWNKEAARKCALYAEYKCFGPGADTSHRASFVKQLSEQEAANYTRERVLF